jgi:hypothetical protein
VNALVVNNIVLGVIVLALLVAIWQSTRQFKRDHAADEHADYRGSRG